MQYTLVDLINKLAVSADCMEGALRNYAARQPFAHNQLHNHELTPDKLRNSGRWQCGSLRLQGPPHLSRRDWQSAIDRLLNNSGQRAYG